MAIIFVVNIEAEVLIPLQRSFEASWLLGGLKVWLAQGKCAVAIVWAWGIRTARPSSLA